MPQYCRFVILAIWVSTGTFAFGQNTARELVEKAVQAHGGKENLQRLKKTHSFLKGASLENGNWNEILDAEEWQDLPSRDRLDLRLKEKFNGFQTVVVDGASAWTFDGTDYAPMGEQDKKVRMTKVMVCYFRLIYTILEDKTVELTMAKPSLINSVEALGVMISKPGYPEITFYFDPKTRLHVGTQYKDADGYEMKFIVTEHMKQQGATIAKKTIGYANEKEILRGTLHKIIILDNLPDEMFRKP